MNEAIITHIIDQHLSPNTQLKQLMSVSGGCINDTYRMVTSAGSFFLKINQGQFKGMFEAEMQGLAILQKHSPIQTPRVLAAGILKDQAYLLIEWIEQGSHPPSFWSDFAQNLARQHRCSQGGYGLEHDNFIGSLPQTNNQHKEWSDFFIAERLDPQVEQAVNTGLLETDMARKFQQLYAKLDHLIPKERPALLHGDLWSGNFMCSAQGTAIIYDPAVHYGHRETELAFTQLFGGFAPDFYQAYDDVFPLEPGFDDRVDIHNLYPLLVHVNLFGSSYLSGIKQTLKKFI